MRLHDKATSSALAHGACLAVNDMKGASQMRFDTAAARAALEAHLRAALVEATRQPATESDPAPHPGQLWHFSDWHHGNVLGVVEGTGDRDVWHITTFTWFRDCWIKGYRNALFGPADFKRDGVTYVGTLPPPKEWHCAAAVRSLAENGDG
jgi:hypothetical protein